jgi:hypothetical protein
MTTLATSLSPTGTFEHLDEHFAVHGGYCTYRNKGCNDPNRLLLGVSLVNAEK